MNHNGESVALHNTGDKDPRLGGRIRWQFPLQFPPVAVNILEAIFSVSDSLLEALKVSEPPDFLSLHAIRF
jgi:hypothetical protein